MHTKTRARHTALIAAIAGALALAFLTATPAMAEGTEDAPAVAPQLSITITDDHEATQADDQLSYTIVVENLGTTDAVGLVVTQSVPDGMAFGSADPAGALDSALVSWTLDVKAAGTSTVSTRMSVGETPDDLLRLATVACAQSGPAAPPIVCASDSNLLPAGEAAASTADPGSVSATDGATWWIVGGSALVVGLSVVAVILILRRRKVTGSAA